MPIRLCLATRCPNPATYRGRCDKHKRQGESKRAGKAIYNTAKWKNTRKAVLAKQPICAHCDNALAVDVHHKVDLADGGAPYDLSNLVGLCKTCHGQESMRRRNG